MRGRGAALTMQGRGPRRDEPFNPFAPNADKERKKRKDMREKTQRPPRQTPQQQPKAKVDYAQKQKEALEKLKARGDLSKPAQPVESKPVVASSTAVERPKPVQRTVVPEQTKAQSRDDHLAKLKEKSAATAQFAKEAKDAKVDLETEKVKTEIIAEKIVESEVIEVEPDIEEEIGDLDSKIPGAIDSKGSLNVFKTIKTTVKSSEKRPKKRKGHDKKGGGKQPQSKKLDRRKYLEYKYAARELLDNEDIKEEHRSNILGQIWAKGERIGTDDAINFIRQKEEELIIPAEICGELISLIKKYTTKR